MSVGARLGPQAAADAARALAPAPRHRTVPIARAVGRMLAETVCADRDAPAADASAMDGWAVRCADTPGRLRVVGESAAGRPWTGSLDAGSACRIATGALLPAGADSVVRLEDATADGDVLTVSPVARGRDVRPRGSEMAAGEPVLGPGRVLTPHDVGLLASAGRTRVRCQAPLPVALVVSGSELVDVGVAPDPGMVVDSNGPMLHALVEGAGGTIRFSRRVRDGARDLDEALREALGAGCAMVITVGGASVGRHDHVRGALGRLGAVPASDGLAMRPGRPAWLGTVQGVPVLALPGNPGAAMIVFHLVGRALLGLRDVWSPMALAADVDGGAPEARFIRCPLTAEGLLPASDQRPSSVRALGGVDAIAWIPPGVGPVPAGTPVAASLVR